MDQSRFECKCANELEKVTTKDGTSCEKPCGDGLKRKTDSLECIAQTCPEQGLLTLPSLVCIETIICDMSVDFSPTNDGKCECAGGKTWKSLKDLSEAD